MSGVPRHRSRHCSRCFPQLSSWRPASRTSRKQTVVEWCCSAFAESVTSGTAKALPHCAEHGYLFLFSFSQASRAKSIVALARSLQLQQSTFSTCTIQLCTGLDSCHVLDVYTHLFQDLGNLGHLLVSSDPEQIGSVSAPPRQTNATSCLKCRILEASWSPTPSQTVPVLRYCLKRG